MNLSGGVSPGRFVAGSSGLFRLGGAGGLPADWGLFGLPAPLAAGLGLFCRNGRDADQRIGVLCSSGDWRPEVWVCFVETGRDVGRAVAHNQCADNGNQTMPLTQYNVFSNVACGRNNAPTRYYVRLARYALHMPATKLLMPRDGGKSMPTHNQFVCAIKRLLSENGITRYARVTEDSGLYWLQRAQFATKPVDTPLMLYPKSVHRVAELVGLTFDQLLELANDMPSD